MFAKASYNIIDQHKKSMGLFTDEVEINDDYSLWLEEEQKYFSIRQQEDENMADPKSWKSSKFEQIENYEPCVKLVTEEEYAKITETHYEHHFSEEYQSCVSEASVYSPKSLSSKSDIKTQESSKLKDYIVKVWNRLIQKQEKVDEGTFVRKGPGRRRQNSEKTSSEFNSMIKDYLREKFLWLSKNKKWKKRMDAVITFYLRALKKCAYFFIEKAAAKNMYKRKNPAEYSVAFAESYIAFLSSINAIGTQDLLQSFCEYIVIYFPNDKCTNLINTLAEQNDWELGHLKDQTINLDRRDVTSKRNIARWAASSQTFNQLLKLSLEVLNEPKLVRMNNGIINHLNKIANDVIYQ